MEPVTWHRIKQNGLNTDCHCHATKHSAGTLPPKACTICLTCKAQYESPNMVLVLHSARYFQHLVFAHVQARTTTELGEKAGDDTRLVGKHVGLCAVLATPLSAG
jgi:hypothetical protein